MEFVSTFITLIISTIATLINGSFTGFTTRLLDATTYAPLISWLSEETYISSTTALPNLLIVIGAMFLLDYLSTRTIRTIQRVVRVLRPIVRQAIVDICHASNDAKAFCQLHIEECVRQLKLIPSKITNWIDNTSIAFMNIVGAIVNGISIFCGWIATGIRFIYHVIRGAYLSRKTKENKFAQEMWYFRNPVEFALIKRTEKHEKKVQRNRIKTLKAFEKKQSNHRVETR